MVEVQLRGFPEWTEYEDLKYVIDECGYPATGVTVNWNGALPIAAATVTSWSAADAVVQQLNGFEFTPGYPLQVRVKPGQNRPTSQAAGKGKSGLTYQSAGKGKSGGRFGFAASANSRQIQPTRAPNQPILPIGPTVDSESGVKDCIGAGRIEGWFVQSKSLVDDKGWGHVQSYSYEGNLVYRHALSPLLGNHDYKQKEPVTFEVVMVKGQAEAVRLAPEGADENQAGDDALVEAYEAQAEESDPKPSWKSQKRREKEEQDGRVLFFGGFGPDVDEDVLWKFAQQAGNVRKVKIFYDINTWVSKGCGKVFFGSHENAENACELLHGTVLNDRIVTVEPIGAESNRPAKRAKRPPPIRADVTQEMPKQLPLSMFSEDQTPQEKINICIAAFEDLLQHHDPVSTGNSMIIMIRNLVMEVNDIFGPDADSLQAFAAMLRKYPWFRENGQQVKWQASKQRVNISKFSQFMPQFHQWKEEKAAEVEMRKHEQMMMGKPVFQMPQKP